mmetsp:Transcript_63484/g.76340  ORF Transcript_63484/g.76340 Transcript_63484/m.76340 type:complete len:82 (-) Transcript_63484:80-325(-)
MSEAPSGSAPNLRQTHVLKELNAIVHTIESISVVLDEILALTEPQSSSPDHRARNENVMKKHQHLHKELQAWGDVMKKTSD